MNLYRKLEDFPRRAKGGALTIGNFDGVHLGHSQIIKRLREHADMVSGIATVFTFDPHPVRLLRPEKTPPPLTWTNRKAALLSELGVDAIVAYPTNTDFLKLSYREFFDQIIVNAIGAKAVIEGPNFFFGRSREGTVQTLQQLCDESSISFEVVNPVETDGIYISSSRIRDLVRHGDVAGARSMLTRPYRIRGMVTHGAARGTSIGFPTANLDAIDTLIPANGVYAGIAHLDGRSHLSAINIGPNPTFGELAKKVEVHILNFEESIYGKTIEVDFMERLRDIRQFDSAGELQKQLSEDVAEVRRLVK